MHQADQVTARRMWRHDLRNQLGIVLGFCELAMQGLGNDDRRRADLREIHAAATRAMELIRQIPPDEGP